MLTSLSSKAMMTKAKAINSRHLTAGQYQELMRLKSVAGIAAYLKEETFFGEALANVQPASIHRDQLETMLRKSRYGQYARLMRYDASTADSYYRHLMREGEIKQILEMIRLLNTGHPERFVTQYPAFLEHGASFSFAALAGARSFVDLIRVLDRTPYAGELRLCRPAAPGGRVDYTACETTLLAGYYGRLERLIDRQFRGRVRAQLHDLLQTHVELRNIGNLYRMKQSFPDTPPEELRRMLLPSWRRISGGDLEALLAAPSAERFSELLRQSRCAKYFGEGDFLFLEYRADCIEYRLARHYLYFASDAPTAFTAFMILCELELDNIVTIIEGVRYGVSPDEISSMLIVSESDPKGGVFYVD